MKMILFLTILLIIFSIFILLKYICSNFIKSIFFTLACSSFIIYIIFNPKICLNSTLNGINLFINSVFVYIFPFLVLINIMLSYDAVSIYSKIFGNLLCKPLRLPKNCSIVLIVSIICGYPLGAKYSCDLYKKKAIDFNTCEKLFSIASNPSPLFIIGSVGTSMLNNSKLGFLLLISCYLSCFIMGIFIPTSKPFLGRLKNSEKNNKDFTIKEENKIGNILKQSIDDSFRTSISIGGFIVFFSVITSIIKNNMLFYGFFQKISQITSYTISKTIQSLLLGSLEMTNGCNIISSNNINLLIKLIFISFFLEFSGLSIIAQVYSIIYKYNFSITRYIKRKFIHGILCSFLTFLLYRIDFLSLSSTVFNNSIKGHDFLTSTNIFIISLVFLFIPFILIKLNKLFNRIP